MANNNKLKLIIGSLFIALIICSCVIGYFVFDKLSAKKDESKATSEQNKPEATSPDKEQKKQEATPPEAIAPDNEQNPLAKMNLYELLNYAVLHPEHRGKIMKEYFIGKFHLPRDGIVVTANPQVASSKGVSERNTIVMGPNSASYIEILAPISLNFKLICTDFTSTELKGIFQSINKHLPKVLNIVNFEDCTEEAINQLEGTFKLVQYISLPESRFVGNKKCHLSEVFPNANYMELELNNSVDIACVEENVPRLEHLEFFGSFSNENANINNFLKSNGQLKSLGLWDHLHTDFFKVVSESLPNLENLQIHVHNRKFFMKGSFEKADLKNLKALEIFTDFDPHHAPEEFPFTASELEELHLIRFDINDRWINIITQQKKVKLLVLEKGALTNDQWLRITHGLPELQSVTAIWNRGNAEGILCLMNNNHLDLKQVILSDMNMDVNARLKRDARKSIDSAKWKMLTKPGSPDVTFLHVSIMPQFPIH